MLNSFNDLRRFDVVMADGSRAGLDDILFDDRTWCGRFARIDLGHWLMRDRALVELGVIARIDTESRRIRIDVTEDQARAAPHVDDHRPLADQLAEKRSGTGVMAILTGASEPRSECDGGDPHLRSMMNMLNYRVESGEERLGRIEDVLFDPLDCRMRHVVVDGGRLLPGRRFVLSVDWITRIDHDAGVARMEVTPDQIESAPAVEDIDALDRSSEAELYRHYNMAPYWL